MKWLLLLVILVVAALAFALWRRVQEGSNTYQRRHPSVEEAAVPSPDHAGPGPGGAPDAVDDHAVPAAEEGWDEAPEAPPEVPVDQPSPDPGTQQSAKQGDSPDPAGEAWSDTPPTDEHATEVRDLSSLASSGTMDSEIAELEGERQSHDDERP